MSENLSNISAKLVKTTDKKKKADLEGIIKVAEFINSDGPIVGTCQVAKIYYAQKSKHLGNSSSKDNEKQTRIKSSEFFQKISHLNVKQIYMFGRAFLMENHGQKVNELINRFTHIINTKKVLDDVIMTEIGDIFKQSLCYMDTKRDRDVKALFAQATSVSFVAKLQGISNKTSIMNARYELQKNINHYSDIIETSKLVRNDMNEQQNRLTKRIIEKRKQKEIRLPEQYDNRGQMLKYEQFPEMPRIIEGIFDAGSMDETIGGGLESHPRLITSTRYRSIDNTIFMHQARKILLSCAPPDFTISLSSCYNYTENYRENSSQAKQHHAGRNINDNISLRRPPRCAVVDNKQVVNLHWLTCNVNYIVDKAANDEAFVIDSKDAKRIVLADCCPVQKPGKTWKQIELPDHDWDQSRTNAITPMSHLFLETNVTHQEAVPLLLTPEDCFIHSSQRDSVVLHVTRTGKAVTLLNLSYYEPETTNRAFNEIFLLLTKPVN